MIIIDTKKIDGRVVYKDRNKRVKFIFEQIWRHGSLVKALPYIKSESTGKQMSKPGVLAYLKRNGYKIIFGPYLCKLDGTLIEPETL